MKFLDERIEFDFSNLGNTYDDSTYRYDVLIDGELVFVGNVFIESTSTGPIIDVTDIVRNYFEVLKPSFPILVYNGVITSTPQSKILKEVAVILYNKEQTDEDSLIEEVISIYRQPNYNSVVSDPVLDVFGTSSKKFDVMLQGFDGSNASILEIYIPPFLPTYPSNMTDKLTFDYVGASDTVNGIVTQSLYLRHSNGRVRVAQYLIGEGYYEYSLPLSKIFEGLTTEEPLYLETNNTNANAIQSQFRVAKFDCSSRYFLKWRDRYGMPQIQPFKGTYNYKENITRNTVTNYKNTKKLTDVTVQGSWLLNTDYIPEKLYPFYESIFVSPWLQLYDSKEDKLYDVILVNTEYDEKTFNNQSRNLFNLQLEVELDTTQKIIY